MSWKGLIHYKAKQPTFLINRKRGIHHYDNACLHTAQLIKDFLGELGWGNLLYPPYSFDFTPDYHLVRGL